MNSEHFPSLTSNSEYVTIVTSLNNLTLITRMMATLQNPDYMNLSNNSPLVCNLIKVVYLSAVNADVQGTAKWIELNQTGNSCASVQSAFPAVVACYV